MRHSLWGAPKHWDRPGYGRERRTRNLKRRFAAVTAAIERPAQRRWLARQLVFIALVSAVAFVGTYMVMERSPWPPGLTLRHIAAAPNCDAARMTGLAPARRGEPGYYGRHDRDGDGIACEPWHPLTRSGG